jgi:hypothetical protein
MVPCKCECELFAVSPRKQQVAEQSDGNAGLLAAEEQSTLTLPCLARMAPRPQSETQVSLLYAGYACWFFQRGPVQWPLSS